MSKKIVVISGYFNPLHVGHLDYIATAKSLGDELWVVVNTDQQVKLKGSFPFHNEHDRLRIVRSLRPVDRAILSFDRDSTVIKTLQHIVNTLRLDGEEVTIIFANGGDRVKGNTPEEVFCIGANIKTVYGIGGRKVQSSSNLIKEAQDNGAI